MYGFLKKCTDWFKQMYGLYGFLKKKGTNCTEFYARIVRFFINYVYYGFFLKMYGFFSKSFVHPVSGNW